MLLSSITDSDFNTRSIISRPVRSYLTDSNGKAELQRFVMSHELKRDNNNTL